jgi:hypothetical protein
MTSAEAPRVIEDAPGYNEETESGILFDDSCACKRKCSGNSK